jgi:predicted dithiol-disulfide oxidoreductase (DUF899 family)
MLSYGSDFNYDYHASFTLDEIAKGTCYLKDLSPASSGDLARAGTRCAKLRHEMLEVAGS